MGQALPKFARTAAIGIFIAWCGCASSADLALVGGDIGLNITSASAGQQPDPVTDETVLLEWTTQALDPTKKIIVQTGNGSPRYSLTIQGINVSADDGVAAGVVPLTTTPADLIVSIPADIPPGDPGTCTLRYAASANASAGSGSDVHTVTFTVVDQ